MDLGKALTFITEDEKWIQKLGIGAGVILVSTLLQIVLIGFVGHFIVAGYCVRLLQNVRDGHSTPLPEWDQWSEDMTRGFKLFLAMLIWALPIIAITIPMTIGGIMTDSGNASEVIGGIIIACGSCVVILYSLFIALSTPGIAIAFAQDEEISSGLQLTEIWQWTRANLGAVIIVVLVHVVASFIFSIVGFIGGLLLCVVGLIITLPLSIFVSYIFQYHLLGQLAQEPNRGHQVEINDIWADDNRDSGSDIKGNRNRGMGEEGLSLPTDESIDNH